MLQEIFEFVIIPLLIAITGYAIKFINIKTSEITSNTNNEIENKYINLLNTTITDCVKATTQTYVESLKASGSFDKEAQEKAFKQTYDAVYAILTEDAKEVLTSAIGDLNLYITQKIEAGVIDNK